ncbi:MAG: YjbQ family protein [Candidatus Aenigmarchaeota archaeon]|nr:YjbQ family protein [Candidatus Aenigmarchaeota archaeon]
MAVATHRLTISAGEDLDIVDITVAVQQAVAKGSIKDGTVTIFAVGSTASVSTMEFEPGLVKDLAAAMERIAPSDDDYAHHQTWNDGNGKSHVRATVLGPSLTVPFQDRKLLLGTWQNIVLLDFDVPARRREVVLQVLGE